MSDLPILVFANLGDEDNLVLVKRFAHGVDADAWIDQQKVERPGAYIVIHESEFDAGY
jgi:hypothetical protein